MSSLSKRLGVLEGRLERRVGLVELVGLAMDECPSLFN